MTKFIWLLVSLAFMTFAAKMAYAGSPVNTIVRTQTDQTDEALRQMDEAIIREIARAKAAARANAATPGFAEPVIRNPSVDAQR
jgi:hypothetical protein